MYFKTSPHTLYEIKNFYVASALIARNKLSVNCLKMFKLAIFKPCFFIKIITGELNFLFELNKTVPLQKMLVKSRNYSG